MTTTAPIKQIFLASITFLCFSSYNSYGMFRAFHHITFNQRHDLTKGNNACAGFTQLQATMARLRTLSRHMPDEIQETQQELLDALNSTLERCESRKEAIQLIDQHQGVLPYDIEERFMGKRRRTCQGFRGSKTQY